MTAAKKKGKVNKKPCEHSCVTTDVKVSKIKKIEDEMFMEHTSLTTKNLPRLIEFYSKLGFKQVKEYTSDKYNFVIMDLHGFLLELGWFEDYKEVPHDKTFFEELRKTTFSHMAFRVKNIFRIEKYLKEEMGIDCQVICGMTVRHQIFIQDPDGNWLEFIQRT